MPLALPRIYVPSGEYEDITYHLDLRRKMGMPEWCEIEIDPIPYVRLRREAQDREFLRFCYSQQMEWELIDWVTKEHPRTVVFGYRGFSYPIVPRQTE